MIARMAKQDELLLASISTDLSNLVSGVVRIDVEEDKALGNNLIWAWTSEGKRFSLRELSDGTLRLLALTVLCNDPDQTGTLLLEEPENGIHPFRVKLLVSLLRSMATDFNQPPRPGERLRQVLVTSHSPALVSQLEDSEILFAIRLTLRSTDLLSAASDHSYVLPEDGCLPCPAGVHQT